METLLHKIGTGILVVGMTVANWFGVVPSDYFVPLTETVYVSEAPSLGGSVQTNEVRALFETTLASRITSSATSMTLTSATDKDGTVLASSTYAFIIDEGTSVEEFVSADCTGTACTNMSRGLSVRTGTTTVAALQFEHRRGASVKITDAPTLIFLTNVFRGSQNIENILHYNTHPTFVATTDIVDKKYVDDTAFSGAGVIDATESARGVSELATQLETASSSISGSSGPLVIQAKNATSTWQAATSPLRVLVTQNSGFLDQNFLPATTTKQFEFATSTYIGDFQAWEVGKFMQVFTATSTFTVPTGVKRVVVTAIGGGGGGGALTTASDGCAGGGGAAAFVQESIDVSATTSIYVNIGWRGAGGTSAGVAATPGASTVFSNYLTAGGGGLGVAGDAGAGGAGGTATGGDLNVNGRAGFDGRASVITYSSPAGKGGDVWGGYGYGGLIDDAYSGFKDAYGYGGGGGGWCSAGSAGDGGAGTAGILIVRW